MKTFNIKFDERRVTRYFLEDKFKEIPQKFLMDIIPAINSTNLKDLHILKIWEDHFQSMKIPYAITRIAKIINTKAVWEFALWKEKKVWD